MPTPYCVRCHQLHWFTCRQWRALRRMQAQMARLQARYDKALAKAKRGG